MDLILGPGHALTGEVMWDQSQMQRSKGQKPVCVKLSAQVSSNEHFEPIDLSTAAPEPKPQT